MNRIQVVVIFMFCYQIINAQTREICITLDDLPAITYDYKNLEFKRELIGKLIRTFRAYEIPAIGFVNESKLYENGKLSEQKVDLLRTWLEAGYELGNHTYAHKDYHKVTFDKFTEDILKGERVCKDLVKEYDQQYIYFRHPFLHVGLDKTKHDLLKNFLGEHDYIEAPVSIDNDDYIFAYAYSKASFKGDQELMRKIGKDSVSYMEKKLLYFQRQSEKLLRRNVKQILLLHANLINADYLDDLAAMYQSLGYRFISMKEALEDDAYEREITVYNNWGISWIYRWALSKGKKGDFFKSDPETPEYVKDFLSTR